AYPYAGFAGNVAKALSSFPQVQGNNTVNAYGTPIGFSTYHSLQVILNKEFSNGLTMYSNYVWSKNLTNVESSMVGSNPGAMDIYNLKIEKVRANDDLPHMFKGFVSYDLPFGNGRKFAMPKVANAVFGGWTVSGIVNYFNGTPLSFTGSSPIATAWNGGANRLNIASGELGVSGFDKKKFELSTQNSANNTYLNKTLYADPLALTLGTSSKRPGIRGFGTINEDFGLQKNFRFSERTRFQIRSEFLNAFNRSTLGGITTGITSPAFGQITSVSGNRSIQFGMRLDF
ncbi:MAG: hypothetical protein ACRD8O_05680, partial [Bryobacteraceae bacterium]